MQNSTTPTCLVAKKSQTQTRKKQGASRLGIWLKRAFDMFVSIWGLVTLAPLFLVIAILIKRDSPGPVFFRGPRIGKKGNVFRILKFRTMYERPESYQGPRVTAKDDPRVTRVGRWLRDTKLNELPQLWNVLRGEMSLVGPRPEDLELGKTWPLEARQEVLSVRPGITSPASVLFRDEESLLSNGSVTRTYLGEIMPTKLRLDQLYVRHRSFWMDLDIMFWTILVLLPRFGSVALPEERLFNGPLSLLMRRYVSWFSIDLIVTFTAIGVTGLFWRSLGPLNVGLSKAAVIALGFAVLESLVCALWGVNRTIWSRATFADALDLVPAVSLATGIAMITNEYWSSQRIFPIEMILMAAGLAFAGFVAVRYRGRLLEGILTRWLGVRSAALEAQERVLIVGGGEAGQFLAWWLQNGKSALGFRVIGFVDDDLFIQDALIRGIRVLGRREDIPAIVSDFDVGIIIFAIHNIPESERNELLQICRGTLAKIVELPDIMQNLRAEIAAQKPGERSDSQTNRAASGVEIPHIELASWLDELDAGIAVGDLDAVAAQVQAMRAELAGHSIPKTDIRS